MFFFLFIIPFLGGQENFQPPPTYVNILTKQSLEAESLRKQSLEALINGLQQNHNCVKVLEIVTKI